MIRTNLLICRQSGPDMIHGYWFHHATRLFQKLKSSLKKGEVLEWISYKMTLNKELKQTTSHRSRAYHWSGNFWLDRYEKDILVHRKQKTIGRRQAWDENSECPALRWLDYHEESKIKNKNILQQDSLTNMILGYSNTSEYSRLRNRWWNL